MRKQFLFLILCLIVRNTIQAQTRGTKIGYIDMEYILQNVPNYIEAENQLEQKAQEWKQQVEIKKTEINKLKEALKAEQALLTKELIEERQTEINFLENEKLEYQQKRFGPNGDLMLQKTILTKPIQDQVFTAVQDIAEAKKYDFIFDKTSDLTMLFVAKRFDISDQVIRVLNRSEKREQLTKKQLKEEDAKDLEEDAIVENPALAERKKALEDKKAARDTAIADRKLLQEQKKKEIADRKIQLQIEREAKKSGVTPVDSKTEVIPNDIEKETAKTAATEAKQKLADEKAKVLEDRKKAVEDRKRDLEEKRKQVLEERKTMKISAIPVDSNTEVIPNDIEKETEKTAAAEAQQKLADEKAKVLEDRKKVVEDRKRDLEEKRKQVLEERKTMKINVTPVDSKTEIIPNDIEKETEKTAAAEAKQKLADEKAKVLEDRKKVVEDRKRDLEEKRKQVLEERKTIKINVTPVDSKTEVIPNEIEKETAKTAAAEAKQKLADEKAKVLEERKKVVEDRKDDLEDKRKQALKERGTKKPDTISDTKVIDDAVIPITIIDSTKTEVLEKIEVEDPKQKQTDARAKIVEERKKVIENYKKALEERKKKVLEDREAAKKANEEKLKATK